MTKTTTIQISVYNWYDYEELIYQTQINSDEEFLALSFNFGNEAKYKRVTDKNWYRSKTMLEGLFRKEIREKVNLKHKIVAVNDLTQIVKKHEELEPRRDMEEISESEEFLSFLLEEGYESETY